MKATALLILLAFWHATAFAADTDVDAYLKHIKPVLKERCFACHGALKQKGKLRLDTAAAMRTKGIFKDGELLSRITSSDLEERMPPEGEALHAHEIEAIKKWMAKGAPGPTAEKPEDDPASHWAFQRIERPKGLAGGDANPIDVYFAALHKSKGLVPQPAAARTLLLRRLYLDLTGLPPTAEQLASKQPLPKIIDGLLASPHYGERWGRHWMDVWRYSDWYGLGKEVRDSQKHLWRWREWIVTSLNENKGYDRMISEMLAGDEVAPNDPKIIAATGFLARSYYKFNRTTWLDNTVEHTGKAFMGLTMNCAKCHDHKYDPINHVDYYKFRAIFEPYHVRVDGISGETNLDKDGLTRAYDGNLDAPTYLHKRGQESSPAKDKKIQPGPPTFIERAWQAPKPIKLPVEAWNPGVKKFLQEAHLAKAQAKVAKARAQLQKQNPGKEKTSVPVKHKTPLAKPTVGGTVLVDGFQKARPDLWELVGKDWRYQGGLLSLTKPSLGGSYLRSKLSHPQDFELSVKFQTTGGKQWKSTGIRFDVDKDGKNSHTVYASAHAGGKVHLFHTVAGKDIYSKAFSKRPIKLNQEYVLNLKVRGDLINAALDGQFLFAFKLPRRQAGSIELFAYDATADFYAIELKTLPANIALKTTNQKAAPIVASDITDLAKAQLNLAETEYAFLKACIDADNAIYRKIGKGSAATAGRLQVKVALAKTQVDMLNPKKKANALKQVKKLNASLKSGKFSKSYPPLPGASQKSLLKLKNKDSQASPTYPKTSTGRRTALAKWLTHRDHPLAARVAVNHIWLRHFGTPLVETVVDFGLRAPKPLHQDLLDYLAVELIESGWDMKHLHRLMLSSKAWQRNSSNFAADKKTLANDLSNQYYWRMNNRRMEAQVVRDSLLSLAGTLDLTQGGPSVAASPKVRRRSLYLFHSRDGRSKFLATFDDADVFACYRRSESIVPQQALAMMNSQTAVEATSKIASGFKPDMGSEAFVQAAFLKILAREPTAIERTESLSFLKTQPKRDYFIHVLINHNDFLVIR
jgi:mono/diheme cytochrome c family protein